MTACSEEDDKGPPFVFGAEYYDPQAYADVSDPYLDTPPHVVALPIEDQRLPVDLENGDALDYGGPVVPTYGRVALVFNELLDGDTVQTAVEDDKLEAGGHKQVNYFVPNEGLLQVIDVATGADISSWVEYWPNFLREKGHGETFDVQYVVFVRFGTASEDVAEEELVEDPAFLPAASEIHIRMIADKIADKAGNTIAAANVITTQEVDDGEGNMVEEEVELEDEYYCETGTCEGGSSGRKYASVIVFQTESIQVLSAEVPSFGLDGTPYDADIEIAFNTGMDAATGAGNILLVQHGTGAVIGTTVAGGGTTLVATPNAALEAGTTYDLRVEGGVADDYGIIFDDLWVTTFTTN